MLENCPQCSYSLTGLPVEHACPECGLRYDGQSEVWQAQWDRYGRSHALPLIIPASTFIPFWLIMSLRGDWSNSLFLSVLIFGLIVGVVIHFRFGQSRPRVATLPDGLFVLRLFGKPRLIPWNQIVDADGSNKRGLAQVRLKNGRKVTIRYWSQPSPLTPEFATCIRARIESINAGEANALGTTKHTKTTK